MTKINEVYRCNICGNMVEMVHTGAGELVCCGQPMELLAEKNQDEGLEKHVPVIEKNDEGVIIKIGNDPHPMEEDHYIEWVEIITDNGNYSRKFLKPGEKPEVSFPVKNEVVSARIYCNVHGLWKT